MWRHLLNRILGRPRAKVAAAMAMPPTADAIVPGPTPERAQWRNEEISRSEIVVGELRVTATMEMSTSSGLLRVVGESHYQATLRAAKDASMDEEPVFLASLIPEPTNPYDPNAIRVAIEPLGTIGYLARESAARYAARIAAAAPTVVKCPVKLYGGVGEKVFVGAVVDVALSEGARLTSWRPDEKVDYEANARYHELRNAVLELVRTTKTIESSDAAQAIANYTDALKRACAYERFAAERNLFPLMERGASGNEVGIVDRLTLCLVRAKDNARAIAVADGYFTEFPAAAQTTIGKTILKRLEKIRSR